jgi:SAM-dependent methyltransferase
VRASTASEARVGPTCRACGSIECQAAFRIHRGTIYLCKDCDGYFIDDGGKGPANQETLFYSTIDEARYREYFRPFRSGQYQYVLERLGLPTGSTLLDVGASFGWMVEVGLKLHFDAYGVEPGDAEYSPELNGRIFRASLEQYCTEANRTFDVITIWHVLEHLRDPPAAVEQMKSLLAPGGLLVIALPTTNGSVFHLARLFYHLGSPFLLNEMFYSHNPNMHFFYPSTQCMVKLVKRFGFEIVRVETLESFDWTTIWKRVHSPLGKWVLRQLGPLIRWSRLSARENLVIIARKSSGEAN